MSITTKHKVIAAVPIQDIVRKSLDEYGAKIDVQPIKGGDFISVDGESYQPSRMNDRVDAFPAFDDDPQKYYNERTELMGKYCTNNSTVAFVSPDGVLVVGPATSSNMKLLLDAGYKEGGFHVPMSNGERFVRPDTAERDTEIWEKAQREWATSDLESFRSKCAKQAEKNGVQTTTPDILSQEGVRFMKVDGVVYAGGSGDKIDVIPNAKHPNDAYMRPEQAGTYDQNNGVLAFVDTEGALYVGKGTSENRDALQKAGYKEWALQVPFSNHEHAVSWSTQLDPTKTHLRALDPKLIGDMQENFGLERNPDDIMNWYARVFEDKEAQELNA